MGNSSTSTTNAGTTVTTTDADGDGISHMQYIGSGQDAAIGARVEQQLSK